MPNTEQSEQIRQICRASREASRSAAAATRSEIAEAVKLAAGSVYASRDLILKANQSDLAAAEEAGVESRIFGMLTLSEEKINTLCDWIVSEADRFAASGGESPRSGLKDSDNEVEISARAQDGAGAGGEPVIRTRRMPVGVVLFLCDCRPDLILRSAAASMFSTDAALLRGSQHSANTDAALIKALREGLARSRLSPDLINLIDSGVPSITEQPQSLAGAIGLIVSFDERSKPARSFAAGVPAVCCEVGKSHIYVDSPADIELAVRLTAEAKCGTPQLGGSPGTLLLHQDAAPLFLPALAAATAGCNIEYRGCPRTREFLPDAIPAVREDWSAENEERTLGIKVIGSAAEAISHIVSYGAGGICILISDSEESIRAFELDAPCSLLAVNPPVELAREKKIPRPLLPTRILTLLSVERFFVRGGQG